MDPLYSSGGPAVSSYTSLSYPGANLQPDSMSIFVKQQHLLPSDTCYTPTACHPLSQDLDLELPPAAGSSCSYCSDTRIHMTPQSSASSSLSLQHHRSSDDQVWPSPPLDPRDIQNCVSFQDSPLSVGSIHLPCYSNSPVSPEAWSSPTLSFLPLHGLPSLQPQQQQQQPAVEVDSPAYFHIGTPTSSHDFPLGGASDLPTTPFVGGFHQKRQESFESETAGLDQSFRRRLYHHQRSSPFASTPSPIMAAASLPRQPPTSCSSNTHSSPGQLCAPLPATAPTLIQVDAVKEEGVVKRENGNEEAPARGLVKSHTYPIVASPDTTNAAKNKEPYAKLIYKALMSQPDHRMSLQDIYQWFRENTDRASDENGGWQNSIRHNLSMNKAFTKCDQKQATDGPAPSLATADSGEARAQTQQASSSSTSRDLKRVNEWVLEKSAILGGVESTTRFRKKNSGRRATARYTSHPDSLSVVEGRRSHTDHTGSNMSSQLQQQQQRQHSSIRALSGRKGGCATKTSSKFRGQRCGNVGSSSYGLPMRRYHYQQQQQHDVMMHQGSPDSPEVVMVSNPYFPVLPLSRAGSASLHASPSCSSSSSSSMMAQIHEGGSGYSPETTESPLFSFGLAVQGLADPGPGPGHPGPGQGHGHGSSGSGGRGVSGIGGGAGFHHHHEEGGSGSGSGSESAGTSTSMSMSMNMSMNMGMYEYLTPSPVGEFPFGIADVQVPVQMDYAVDNWSQPQHHHGL